MGTQIAHSRGDDLLNSAAERALDDPPKKRKNNVIPNWDPSSAVPGAAQSPKQTKTILAYVLDRMSGGPMIPVTLGSKPWPLKSKANLSSEMGPRKGHSRGHPRTQNSGVPKRSTASRLWIGLGSRAGWQKNATQHYYSDERPLKLNFFLVPMQVAHQLPHGAAVLLPKPRCGTELLHNRSHTTAKAPEGSSATTQRAGWRWAWTNRFKTKLHILALPRVEHLGLTAP